MQDVDDTGVKIARHICALPTRAHDEADCLMRHALLAINRDELARRRCAKVAARAGRSAPEAQLADAARSEVSMPAAQHRNVLLVLGLSRVDADLALAGNRDLRLAAVAKLPHPGCVFTISLPRHRMPA